MRNLASSAAMLTEIEEVSECRLCTHRRFIQAAAEAYSTSRIRISFNADPDTDPASAF